MSGSRTASAVTDVDIDLDCIHPESLSRRSDGATDTIGGMIGDRRMAAALILAAMCAACQGRNADADSTGMRIPETRPRDGTAADGRREWRTQLMWPDDCEQAFQASHAGNAGGVRVIRLGSAVSLVEVTCAAGSYQPSAIRYKLTGDGTAAHGVPLSFPTYSSEDGRELRLSQELEVWGESVVTPEANEIAILSVGRQTADCGVWARYSLAGDQPTLLAAAARVQCPATPGPPAWISGSSPPPGWSTIPRRD